jgi:hypothetical protein
VAIKRRIFISSPRTDHLDERRNRIKLAIVEEIEKKGYEAQMFGSDEGGRGLATESWSAKEADAVMRRCVGAAILGFPIWNSSGVVTGNPASLVTEYCHYEGALARAACIPILGVLEEGVEERVFFNRYAGDPTIRIPKEADATWATTSRFQAR